MISRQGARSPLTRAAWIAIGYAAVSIVWIGFSDALLGIALNDPADLTQVQTLKGWLFVAATAAALFVVLHRQLRADAGLLQRYQAQRAEVRALSQFRESVIDNASIWINVLGPDARIVLWNKAAEQISGYRRDEVMDGSEIWSLLYPDPGYRDRITAKVAEILNDGTEVEDFETTIRAKSGEEKIIAWNSRRLFDDAGAVVGSVAIGRDITDRRRAELALVARERQLAVLMANLPGMAYRCSNDPRWTMHFVSNGCRVLTGYEPGQLIDNREVSFADLVHPDDRRRIWTEVQLAVAEQRPFELEYRIRRRDGNEIWVWEQGCAVEFDDRLVLEGITIDITRRKEMEQKLALLATQDPLTGLYNRRELEQQFHDELTRAARYERPLGLLWIDVDSFKAINDRFGHLVGDEVLRRLARLLQNNIRNVDYAARWGGEELVIVLPEVGLPEATDMAERLRRLVASCRVDIGDGVVSATVSIGVAAYPEHGQTVEELFEAADAAMYRAKHAGRNRVCAAGVVAERSHLHR